MRVVLEVRGKTSSWLVEGEASQEQVDAMRADGLDIGILENKVPFWVVSCGLLRPWCFAQDVWSLRNPFRK
jgi:hypothetical protein